MDIRSSKIELTKLILNIENENFIQRVIDFINNENSDFWNNLSESEKDEIKKGIEALNNGKRSPYKEVLNTLA